ncbi:hypothetical protein [Neobacillus sp. D3-1R]|uniref:hypothetical protein n=1 Tax=Neobacillus sp. D3-1R TaxID=3445778 RepID=UPI003FA09217
MSRIVLLLILFIFGVHTSVQALSWAYPFVVWKGNVYQVTDEKLTSSHIKKRIGFVETEPIEMTGNYYGNASNAYTIGTGYYEIIGVPYNTAIAVRIGDREWLKAVYVHKAPFHIMNYLSKPVLLLLPVLFFSFVQNRINKRDLPKLS